MQELLETRQQCGGGFAPDVVDRVHLFYIHFHTAYGQILLGRNHEDASGLLFALHIIELRIIHLMAASHGLRYGRVAAHEQAVGPQFSGLFAIRSRTSEHHHVSVESHVLEVLERDGVADAAI